MDGSGAIKINALLEKAASVPSRQALFFLSWIVDENTTVENARNQERNRSVHYGFLLNRICPLIISHNHWILIPDCCRSPKVSSECHPICRTRSNERGSVGRTVFGTTCSRTLLDFHGPGQFELKKSFVIV